MSLSPPEQSLKKYFLLKKIGWVGLRCSRPLSSVIDFIGGLPKSTLRRELLFLTLSNFAFMPAVYVAVHRGFYLEGLVYFYVLLLSTVSFTSYNNRQNVVDDVLDMYMVK